MPLPISTSQLHCRLLVESMLIQASWLKKALRITTARPAATTTTASTTNGIENSGMNTNPTLQAILFGSSSPVASDASPPPPSPPPPSLDCTIGLTRHLSPQPKPRQICGDPQNAVKHPDFWFEDGSIVLVAENTTFRVHKSLLAHHSEFFADLFTVPQPLNSDLIDGLHFVPLSDSLDDVVDVLKVIYHPL